MITCKNCNLELETGVHFVTGEKFFVHRLTHSKISGICTNPESKVSE